MPVAIAPSALIGIHPLASMLGIYACISDAALEMAETWAYMNITAVSPVSCMFSMLLIGAFLQSYRLLLYTNKVIESEENFMSEYVIETKQLTKVYGDQTAVNAVNLHVKRGQIYGLLGRNGAGKTTIMKMLLGLTPITSGEADIFGKNIKGQEKRVYPRIGAIIETPGFYPNLTGTENLEIFARLRGTAAPNAVKNALEVVGLPYKDKKLFGKYSLGMKQRLGIANAILHDPELLILDEPTNGLDPIGIAEVRDFIKDLSVERGKTILISSHILSEIQLLADDIGIIDHGVLLEESSMSELEKKNSKYIFLQVSDVSKAALILEHQFQLKNYSVQDDHTLRLYDTSLDMGAVNKELVMQDITVISSGLCNDTLVDYFKRITGGEGIG